MDCAFIFPQGTRQESTPHTHKDTQTPHRLIGNRQRSMRGVRVEEKTRSNNPSRHHDTDREINRDGHMVNFTLEGAEGEQDPSG